MVGSYQKIWKKVVKNQYFLLIFKTTLATVLVFSLINWWFPLPSPKPYSTIVSDQKATVIHCFLSPDDKWRMFTELNEITPDLQNVIVFKEDKYFFVHFGINPVSVFRALINNVLYKKRTSGASTITMQVARLLEPKSRNYGNKLLEIVRALQLEWHYSKPEILQLYLNLVPFGGNVEGIKSAAVLFFEKNTMQLSLAEITTLAIIPNRPSSLQLGKKNAEIVVERNKWLRRLRKHNKFSVQEINDALSEPLVVKRNIAPKLAPHFSLRMRNFYHTNYNIRTSLDLLMQLKIEQITKNYVNTLRSRNIHNAAVLVINNQTHEVKSYVGSADFSNGFDGGQVDGVVANRSPGSTLKPLIYALAFDEGLATPKTILCDVPTNFGGYTPENYDQHFRGNVSVEFALCNSLNIPAVKMLADLGTDILVDKLIAYDFKRIKKDARKLGLSTALGGCGVSLEELCKLYSSFANQGKHYNLGYLYQNPAEKNTNVGTQNLSPQACFMTTNILTQLTRTDLPISWQNTANLPKIAWKTGTSYGRKDAWSIGYNKQYTVGIWVGNFSGEGVQELSGADIASPLLFNVFNAISHNSAEAWFAPPKGLDFRLVCPETGCLPNVYCSSPIMDYFYPTVSSNKKCTHLQLVCTSPDSSMSYCTSCLPPNGYVRSFYPNYAPELVSFYEKNQVYHKRVPPHNPMCQRIFLEGAPSISSPAEGRTYYLEGANDTTKIMLAAQTANDVNQIFWYTGAHFYRSAAANQNLFFKPIYGSNTLTCTDDKGRKSKVTFEVKYLGEE